MAKDQNTCIYDYGKLLSPYPCQSGLLRQFVIGINAAPLPELPFSSEFTTISTLTIALNDPLNTVFSVPSFITIHLGKFIVQAAELCIL